jgi:hypothetical protein
MDSLALYVLGGFLILIGFLNLIRSRFLGVRRRLTPAASVRARGLNGSASLSSYPSNGLLSGRGLSIVLMMGGGAAVLAAIMAG